jgi:glutathione S-transferase
VTLLFHIMTPDGWTAFEATGTSAQSTRDLTLAEEGFIHCSYAEQLEATIARFYADLPEIVVVSLDPDLLSAEVRDDPTPDGTLFPHVYGPLTIDAVVDVTRRSAG